MDLFEISEAMKIMNNQHEIACYRDESRAYSRKCVKEAGWLLYLDLGLKPITIVDISKGGLGIVVNEPMQTGYPCAIGFKVLIDNQSKRINLWARVIYCVEQDQNGFKVGVRIREYDFHSRVYIEALCGSNNI